MSTGHGSGFRCLWGFLSAHDEELLFTACGGLRQHMTWKWFLLPVGFFVNK